MNPARIKESVAARMRRGVIHNDLLEASHARAPVAPAPAAIAPIMHCVHTGGA